MKSIRGIPKLPAGSSSANPQFLVELLNAGYEASQGVLPGLPGSYPYISGNDYNMCTRFFDVFFQNGEERQILWDSPIIHTLGTDET